jgi:hypothetical protein
MKAAFDANISCCIGDLITALKRETYRHRGMARRARRRAENVGGGAADHYFAPLAKAYDAAAAAFEAELARALAEAASMRRIDAPAREAKP